MHGLKFSRGYPSAFRGIWLIHRISDSLGEFLYVEGNARARRPNREPQMNVGDRQKRVILHSVACAEARCHLHLVNIRQAISARENATGW
jgi:hypothetical protein